MAISILRQIPFLRHVKETINNGKAHDIANNLSRLRDFLANDPSRIFLQLSTPSSTTISPIQPFSQMWNSVQNKSSKKKRRNSGNTSPISNAATRPNYVFAFVATAADGLEKATAILAPIGGVDSSYVYQLVPCPVNKKHPDYFPVMILAEIISLTEGPLYTRIRGKGLGPRCFTHTHRFTTVKLLLLCWLLHFDPKRYAYDASISFHAWASVLYLHLHECTSVVAAMTEFYGILKDLDRNDSPLLSQFSIDTAKASLLYQYHSQRATPAGVIAASLKSVLRGFASLHEETQFEKRLAETDIAAVSRVYNTYFKRFLDPERRVLVIASNPSNIIELVEQFAKPPFSITLQVKELKNLLI